MSIFVTGGTGFIYSTFVIEWTYRSDDSVISIQWPTQDESSLSFKDQHAKFLAEKGQLA